MNIGIFTCSEYSSRKGVTIQSSDVNEIAFICSFQKNVYLHGYLYLLITHTNEFPPVSLKPSQ